MLTRPIAPDLANYIGAPESYDAAELEYQRQLLAYNSQANVGGPAKIGDWGSGFFGTGQYQDLGFGKGYSYYQNPIDQASTPNWGMTPEELGINPFGNYRSEEDAAMWGNSQIAASYGGVNPATGLPYTPADPEFGNYVNTYGNARTASQNKDKDANNANLDMLRMAALVAGTAAFGGFGGFDWLSGLGGEAAAATGIGEAAGGSTLADLYGGLTNMSVVSAPTAATGSALYGAATGAGATGLFGGANALTNAFGPSASGSMGSGTFAGIGSDAAAASGALGSTTGATAGAGTAGGSMGASGGWYDWGGFGDPTSGLFDLNTLGGGASSVIPTDWGSLANPTNWWETAAGGADVVASGGSSVLDLIKQYGQPAAKALGLTNSDGSINWGKIASGGLSAAGGFLSGNAATDAARITADAQLKAAQIAADAAKFKPVGVTTRFGGSKFGYDANGNLTSAGYSLSPDVRAQQDTMMGMAPGLLSQYQGSQAATAPMGQAAQTMMSLGNNYLNTDPLAQAQKYYNDQQAIMAAGRERDIAGTLAGEFNRGTYGLATGETSSGMMASNPRLEALYNAQRQQDLQASANATQGGMDYSKFGSTMTGLGGNMLRDMYGTQSAAYDPYKTAVGGASYLEGLGQQSMDMGINIGAKGTAANAQSGMLMANGMTNAAQTMQPANSYSPWGAMLTGAGNTVQNMTNPQQQQATYDPTRFQLVPFGS